jgi:hypothetical protein
MKKYQIGGSMQSKTSDELNPYKIKTPVAPNPSFVPSGSMDRAQQGVETQKLSEDGNYIITTKNDTTGNYIITTKNDTTTTKPNPFAVKAKEYADQKIKLEADYKLAKKKAETAAKPPMKKGGQVKKSKY